jgi:hypothetical protein
MLEQRYLGIDTQLSLRLGTDILKEFKFQQVSLCLHIISPETQRNKEAQAHNNKILNLQDFPHSL